MLRFSLAISSHQRRHLHVSYWVDKNICNVTVAAGASASARLAVGELEVWGPQVPYQRSQIHLALNLATNQPLANHPLCSSVCRNSSQYNAYRLLGLKVFWNITFSRVFFLSTFCPLVTWFCKAHCTCTCKFSRSENLTFRYRVVSVLVIRLKTPMPFIYFFRLSVQFKKKMKVNLPHHTITLWVWRFSLRDTSIHVKQCLDANTRKQAPFFSTMHNQFA